MFRGVYTGHTGTNMSSVVLQALCTGHGLRGYIFDCVNISWRYSNAFMSLIVFVNQHLQKNLLRWQKYWFSLMNTGCDFCKQCSKQPYLFPDWVCMSFPDMLPAYHITLFSQRKTKYIILGSMCRSLAVIKICSTKKTADDLSSFLGQIWKTFYLNCF